MLSELMDRLKTPTANMSWPQLAAATVFVIVVAVAWRQVVHMITHEV